MSAAVPRASAPADYSAARGRGGYFPLEVGVLDVEGADRADFLQGQLTQDVRGLTPGEVRPAAALTAKGKLVFFGRLLGMAERIRLLVPSPAREQALLHLRKYAVFQRVAICDRSAEVALVGIYGTLPIPPPPDALLLPGEGELSAELLVESGAAAVLENALSAAGAVPVSAETAEVLRVEAGRPLFGRDANETYLPDEVGLQSALSTTKGCYVGQEIVARLRTYGRVNRRLVGFRFPDGLLEPGELLKGVGEAEPGRIERGRVTSAVVSPRFGAIGLGYAFREVPTGGWLVSVVDPPRAAVVSALPFA